MTMIRHRLFAAAAAGLCALTLVPAPLAAQDSGTSAATEEMDQVMAMLGGMFPAEPLTAEQETRLPQAQRIIGRMIPEGTLSELMGSMFDKMLGPIMQAGGSPATATVTRATGLSSFDLDLTPEQTEELASLFDPAWAERQKREMALFPGVMATMMDAMEPGMRKAMSELYAINFTQQELDEIEAFFLTPTGTSYARKSFTMSSDPRVLSASMEAMPALMSTIGSLEQKAAEATADLPPTRGFADLTAAEQAKVAEVTGISVEEIRASLDAQAETDPAEHAH
ncbi:hypothetical protein C0V72_12775 [Porphyrobacter sp. TH134]|uniref:DUF2059 domain-containing protein n=1 Tax=Porphyrobacter sp. TH134 TaxID=2067450 RepID=UPI000C799BB8|nr:DUF2059 domain-containing protein [Porphyrobacter sp. TH134]PLK22822.1 hypothetical protein C0V72_12775 [Porphyrobacter sp. TH134]